MMNPVRMGVLLSVALVAAVMLALVARNMASSHRAPPPVVAAAPAAKPDVRVLVAARDLATGERLSASDFSWQPWPQDNINPAFITDGLAAPALDKSLNGGPVKIETAAIKVAAGKAHELMVSGDGGPAARLVDSIVKEPILKGEPILEAKLVHSGAGGIMAVQLTPGMRAMAVPLTADSGAGGFILPGDHVDVVQSRQADGTGGEKRYVSTTVLHNVRVLAIDQNTGRTGRASAITGQTATLELTPDQAELLVLAKAQGQLTLILRSYADISGASSSTSLDVKKDDNVVKVFRSGGTASDVAVVR